MENQKNEFKSDNLAILYSYFKRFFLNNEIEYVSYLHAHLPKRIVEVYANNEIDNDSTEITFSIHTKSDSLQAATYQELSFDELAQTYEAILDFWAKAEKENVKILYQGNNEKK